ncbi:FAD-binding oxidoreductase [Roseomonas alkaliterrae]|uniref:Glycine/D-amino acid oxidase-like deaminating enzyme n=1 Tax=Neoroseomonas alkaliterrae TaxID=1452450 RepID=A0A840Y8N2_9PROT|nr:glycine/D-amino acid oxidase-like deaminating enzyme [Neoroseomonas alkaliterrae]MBR0674683.1 FAD-binding oxidoreductase [Neoroseomonas alkaliterrae]
MLPPSLYAETAAPAAPTPPLEGEHRADVCIVGGGFTGLSAALHLAEAGASVLLLEAHEPGWGASGRNGGQVNPGLKPDPDEVERDFGPDLGGRMLALSYGAPDALFALVRRHQIACEARQEGTIRAAIDARSAAAARRSAEQSARRGWPVRYASAEEVAAMTGTARYAGAMVDARGGDVHPLSFARGLARAALAQGARIHGGSPAQRIAREAAGWRVTTPGGAVRATHIVLATNGYTDDLWPGLRRSVVPVFSSIAASAPLADEVARAIMPRRASLYEAGRITVYYRMDRANRLLIGGRGPQRPIGDTGPIRYLTDYAARLWPALAGVRWTHGWNGQLAMTPDHYPHLHEPAPGVIAALGYNGRGVAMATAMGGQIARRLLGTPAEALDMPVTSIRPIPLHGFWRLAVTAKLWEGRIRDRLGL